ncbi:hypothetical protein NKI19_25890 [Mesorhizobium sp. M0751]|uniref:hypothetical protein n=1 Tax=unclassified Mesorhizobium TaxID=325217 RepID=UPI0033396151
MKTGYAIGNGRFGRMVPHADLRLSLLRHRGGIRLEAFPSAVLAHHYDSNLLGEPLSKTGVPNYGDFITIRSLSRHPFAPRLRQDACLRNAVTP